jgi:hypothetical protein
VLPNRFRRKFLVEFTVEESDLLDRLGREHGSRRAAILTGLKLLAGGELDVLRKQVAALEGELTSAQAQHARDASALATATAAAKQGKTTAAALRAEQTAHKQTRADLKSVTAQLQEARRSLAKLQADSQQLIDNLPAQAYCASCRKLVPHTEWAVESTGGAHYWYHAPDGFRLTDGGLGGKRATVLFSRPASGTSTKTQAAR